MRIQAAGVPNRSLLLLFAAWKYGSFLELDLKIHRVKTVGLLVERQLVDADVQQLRLQLGLRGLLCIFAWSLIAWSDAKTHTDR